MIAISRWICGAVALTAASTTHAQPSAAVSTLTTQDARLEQVAERLLIANDPLCRAHMPVAGFIIHSRDQYHTDPGTAFVNGPVAVSVVLPGSAAARELQPGDGLSAIAGVPVSSLAAANGAPLRDAVFDALAQQSPLGPLVLTRRRDGADLPVSLAAQSGCRALVEIRASDGRNARSDGRVIQVDYGLARSISDAQLAVVFAHEFAHLVLEHRRRLSAAGVAKGFFGEFGKNQRLNRQVEVEADRLSVHLLANAGYDPASAPAFWRSSAGRSVAGLSGVYPSPEARARLLDHEIADYIAPSGGPSWPGHLLSRRDAPFN